MTDANAGGSFLVIPEQSQKQRGCMGVREIHDGDFGSSERHV